MFKRLFSFVDFLWRKLDDPVFPPPSEKDKEALERLQSDIQSQGGPGSGRRKKRTKSRYLLKRSFLLKRSLFIKRSLFLKRSHLLKKAPLLRLLIYNSLLLKLKVRSVHHLREKVLL